MPSHNHSGFTASAGNHCHEYYYMKNNTAGGSAWVVDAGSYEYDEGGITTKPAGDHTHTISAEGQSEPHNNLPPYLSVYIWLRTA